VDFFFMNGYEVDGVLIRLGQGCGGQVVERRF
jgi:hypothetical protein